MCMNFAAPGTGWDVARIGDRDEFNVIDQLHRSAFTQESYYIGGMSNVNPAIDIIELHQFGWPDNGKLLTSSNLNNILT